MKISIFLVHIEFILDFIKDSPFHEIIHVSGRDLSVGLFQYCYSFAFECVNMSRQSFKTEKLRTSLYEKDLVRSTVVFIMYLIQWRI